MALRYRRTASGLADIGRAFSSLFHPQTLRWFANGEWERPDLRRALRAYTKRGAWRQFARSFVSQA